MTPRRRRRVGLLIHATSRNHEHADARQHGAEQSRSRHSHESPSGDEIGLDIEIGRAARAVPRRQRDNQSNGRGLRDGSRVARVGVSLVAYNVAA